ncbi:hypothetical protein E5288_WYG015582 [Bos mutus]|uniref:Uncharacterized protein n=1 Tax=Bos mutus TaxID=72004 RepID=A0A6B0S0W7_9CETA|nr:hypothetical protein [Bos mutus]
MEGTLPIEEFIIQSQRDIISQDATVRVINGENVEKCWWLWSRQCSPQDKVTRLEPVPVHGRTKLCCTWGVLECQKPMLSLSFHSALMQSLRLQTLTSRKKERAEAIVSAGTPGSPLNGGQPWISGETSSSGAVQSGALGQFPSGIRIKNIRLSLQCQKAGDQHFEMTPKKAFAMYLFWGTAR